jgi:hypothetical protein
MPTISELGRVDSRQIAIAAEPEVVVGIVGDAERLPEWAPKFAQAVRPEGDTWIIDMGGGTEVAVRMLVNEELGTIDIVRPADPALGARMRVLPNAGGSAFVFTITFPPGTPDAAIDGQMAVIEEELETVRALAEAAAPAA